MRASEKRFSRLYQASSTDNVRGSPIRLSSMMRILRSIRAALTHVPRLQPTGCVSFIERLTAAHRQRILPITNLIAGPVILTRNSRATLMIRSFQ